MNMSCRFVSLIVRTSSVSKSVIKVQVSAPTSAVAATKAIKEI